MKRLLSLANRPRGRSAYRADRLPPAFLCPALLLALAVWTCAAPAWGQADEPAELAERGKLAERGERAQRGERAELAEPRTPPALRFYMGRPIARTMHFTGAEWLIRDEREREERCSLMLANLGVKRGMTVCDMGCGNGFYSLQMAQMTGPRGRVLAVDVQPEMLGYLRQRAEAAGVENVTPILGSFHDPRLPEGVVDLILLVDVYHEFSHPEHMLAAMRRSLKPDGLVVLVEYREEDPEVPIKPLHKMSKQQILKELQANGFKLVKEFDKLPWQHMMFFGLEQ